MPIPQESLNQLIKMFHEQNYEHHSNVVKDEVVRTTGHDQLKCMSLVPKKQLQVLTISCEIIGESPV